MLNCVSRGVVKANIAKYKAHVVYVGSCEVLPGAIWGWMASRGLVGGVAEGCQWHEDL